MERRVVFDFEYCDRYLKQCLTQCFVRAARSNVFQASLVFTTISVVIVYVCVRVFVIVFAFVRAGRHAAMASLFSPSCTILDIIVFLCVCVFVIEFVFVRAAGHVAMSYKPLYDHIGHTQRPHKSAFLSQTSLHSPFFNWP